LRVSFIRIFVDKLRRTPELVVSVRKLVQIKQVNSTEQIQHAVA